MSVDLNPETVSWTTFGFPDPTFTPAALPLIGLRWALWERYLPRYCGDNDAYNFADFLCADGNTRYLGYARGLNAGLSQISMSGVLGGSTSVDRILSDLCSEYIHPDRLEDHLHGDTDANWTIEELLTAAAGGDTADIVWEYNGAYDNGQWPAGKFFPQYYSPWLIQRYKAVNLLRYHRIGGGLLRSSYTEGNSSGYQYSPAAILNDAENHVVVYEDEPGVRLPSLTYSLRSRWDDVREYYNCSFRNVTRIHAEKAKVSGIFPPVYLGLTTVQKDNSVTPPDNPGLGYNFYQSDDAGTLLSFSAPFWTGMTLRELEETNDSARYGHAVDEVAAYADYYPCFHFKEE